MTELGIVKLVRPLQPSNAQSPMAVTELGMEVATQPAINVLLAVSMMALQLPRESYVVFPLATTMLVRLAQDPNAPLPMLEVELPIETLVKPLQPLNAWGPMVVTELGIVTSVRDTQRLNASGPMVVTELGNDTPISFSQSLNAQ